MANTAFIHVDIDEDVKQKLTVFSPTWALIPLQQ